MASGAGVSRVGGSGYSLLEAPALAEEGQPPAEDRLFLLRMGPRCLLPAPTVDSTKGSLPGRERR